MQNASKEIRFLNERPGGFFDPLPWDWLPRTPSSCVGIVSTKRLLGLGEMVSLDGLDRTGAFESESEQGSEQKRVASFHGGDKGTTVTLRDWKVKSAHVAKNS